MSEMILKIVNLTLGLGIACIPQVFFSRFFFNKASTKARQPVDVAKWLYQGVALKWMISVGLFGVCFAGLNVQVGWFGVGFMLGLFLNVVCSVRRTSA